MSPSDEFGLGVSRPLAMPKPKKLRAPAFRAWRSLLGIGSGVAILIAGAVWAIQNRQLLQGMLASDHQKTEEPAPLSIDEDPAEPPKVIEEPKADLPALELAALWVTMETVASTNGRKNLRAHPGTVFRFENWGGVKMLAGPGRKDGQPLSRLETIALQADFRTSYEMNKNGLVIISTEEGNLIFSAARKGEGLALSLLAPDSLEPLVERYCLPSVVVERRKVK